MNVLYSIDTEPLTWEEYRKFLRFLRRKKKIFFIVWSVCMIFSAVTGALAGIYFNAVFLAVLVLIVWGIEYTRVEISGKKIYNSFKDKQKPSRLDFYDDKIVETCEDNVAVIRIAGIYKIYETKTNFYIMVTRTKGIIIIKEKCKDELCGFIRNMK